MTGKTTDKSSAFILDDAAFRKKTPYPLIATNLPGAYLNPAPPQGFDATKAGPTELTSYGLLFPKPLPSDDTAVVKAWNDIFARQWLPQDRIVPILEPRVGRTHRSRHPLEEQTEGNYKSFNWAGAFFGGTAPWASITAAWAVPTVSRPPQPQGPQGGWESSSWIGIDGYPPTTSNDVLQAGIDQYLSADGTPTYLAWFEWYVPSQSNSPAYVFQTDIPNFPVKPGDVIQCIVQYVNNHSAGYVFLANNTTNKYFSITLAPPPGATFAGTSAEWIMEAPELPPSSLPKFTPVVFTSASARSASNAIGNPKNATKVTNVETASRQIVTNATVGNYTVTITDTPDFQAAHLSPLTCLYTDRDGSRVYYAGQNKHLFELAWAGSGWNETDTGAKATGRSPLTCLYAGGHGSRVYYVGPNKNIWELAWTGSGWLPTDTLVEPFSGSALTCLYVEGYGSRVYYVGRNKNIWELAWSPSGWSPTDTLARPIAGSALTCLQAGSHGSRVYYVGASNNSGGANNIFEVAWNGSGWNPPTNTGATPASKSALTCLYAGSNGSRVYYLGSNNDVWEAAWNGSGWENNDTAAPANPGSALTCLDTANSGSRIYYLGANNYVFEVAWNGSGWNPPTYIQAAAEHGSALTCLYAGSNGSRVYFLQAGDTVHESAWTGSGWAVT
jgi:hypothetical protein